MHKISIIFMDSSTTTSSTSYSLLN